MSTISMTSTVEERDRSDSESYSEFADLDSEIRRMSLHAEALLDSIREVTSDEPSSKKIPEPIKTIIPDMVPEESLEMSPLPSPPPFTPTPQKVEPVKPVKPSVEDDDMSEEEERLEEITASIRDLMAEPPRQITSSAPAGAKTCLIIDESESPSVMSKDEDSPGALLITSCTMVWTFVMVLVVHAQCYMLDEDGFIQMPCLFPHAMLMSN